MVFILFMLAMDLGVFHKKDHVIKIKEAAIWTAIWILLAMLFGLLLLFKAEWVHDIRCLDDLYAYVKGTDLAHKILPTMSYAEALGVYRKEIFSQYLAGYFLEESLSIENRNGAPVPSSTTSAVPSSLWPPCARAVSTPPAKSRIFLHVSAPPVNAKSAPRMTESECPPNVSVTRDRRIPCAVT